MSLPKTNTDLAKIIEGVLFASKVPLSAEGIAKIIFADEVKPHLPQIRLLLAQLKSDYENRGMELIEVASGYRFQVTAMAAPFVARSLEDKPSRYSRALLETLALIAYRQPITRGEIEDIRGVVVSTQIIKTLDEHEWIKVVGYKEVPGKPALYATTKYFLDHFGLKSLDELPPLAELKDFEGFTPLPQIDALPEENAVEVAAAEINEDVDVDADVEIEEL